MPDVIHFADKGVFAETEQQLWPVQRVVLKTIYGIPLDDQNKTVPVYLGGHRMTGQQMLTEADYLKFLADDGRSNIDTIEGPANLAYVSKGRRSGGTFLSALIMSWELFRLLQHESPQANFGMPESNRLHVMGVAHDMDQAGFLHQTCHDLCRNVRWLDRYRDIQTQTRDQFFTQKQAEAGAETGHGTVRVVSRTAVAKGLRGFALPAIVLDGFALYMEPQEVYHSLRPSTLPFGDQSKFIAISNPNGVRVDAKGRATCPFYGGFKHAAENDTPGEVYLQIPTWEFNPTFDPDLLSRRLNELGQKQFDAEYGARFVR